MQTERMYDRGDGDYEFPPRDDGVHESPPRDDGGLLAAVAERDLP